MPLFLDEEAPVVVPLDSVEQRQLIAWAIETLKLSPEQASQISPKLHYFPSRGEMSLEIDFGEGVKLSDENRQAMLDLFKNSLRVGGH